MNIIRAIYGPLILSCIVLVKVPFVLTALDKFGNRDLSLGDALSSTEKDKVCLNNEHEPSPSWFKKKAPGSNLDDWLKKKKQERDKKKLEDKIKGFFNKIPQGIKKCLQNTGKEIKKFFKKAEKKIKSAFTNKKIK